MPQYRIDCIAAPSARTMETKLRPPGKRPLPEPPSDNPSDRLAVAQSLDELLAPCGAGIRW